MYIDSHAHLYDEKYGHDLRDVIARAHASGVRLMVAVGVDVASSRVSVEIANQHDGVYAAVGIHPNSAAEAAPGDFATIRDLAREARVVAIGETGLDYYREHTGREVQRDMLDLHLQLASDTGKPVIIHDRDAHAEIAAVVVDWGRARGGSLERPVGVLHCYSGDAELALAASAVGFMISFAGNITYRGTEGLLEVAAAVDSRSLLIETDCPWLSPSPLRGKRNEPANLSIIAAALAAARGLPAAELSKITSANSRRLFGL